MADAVLSFLVKKLWDLLVRESDRFQGVEKQFNELKSDLDMLRCFLEDADAQKHTSAVMRNIVKEIKEIVYDAEDIIETFLLEEELGKTSGIRNTVRMFSKRRGLASDMKSISERISKVIQFMKILGVQQDSAYRDTQSLLERQREIRQTFPSDSEDHLVGLEENVKKLVGYLVEEDSIQVVSITGMGGIGKTTLARQVFNHEMVKNHFDGVAWVCISQQFTRTYVWQTILKQLSSKHDEHRESNMTEEELQDKLFRLLETSNSLIVLDDMWKEEDWDRIEPVFPPKKGWKVLFTSRNENVGLRADPKCVIFKQECLNPDEIWTLFRRIAFDATADFEVDVEMEELGKKMIKHCGRLPLAVKVLGGLLAAQHTLIGWKRVHENIGSHIIGGTSFNERNLKSGYHILYLSFEELPVYLKQCFLYFAHFPEDYPIRVWDLAYYWAAEGIPRPRYYDGATIEEVGNGYIEELVKRNMVISERDMLTSRYETCHLHDMMREVCLRKAEEENFVHIVDIANSQSPCTSRRIAVHQLAKTDHPKWEMQNPKLRSLLIIKKQFGGIKWMALGICFTKLQLMRVLDLSYAKFEGGKLPSSIGKLIHLRYLSLYWTEVSHLPSSMRNLKQLLYLNLNVRGKSPIYMAPNFMKEMRELTYLYLPARIDDKTKLELGNLVNLETLNEFSTKHSSVKDLQRMTKLRNLSIYIVGKGCTMETLSSSLSELRHLEDLTIYLEACRLVEDPMPILEKLVRLKVLKLLDESFSGRRMVCSSRRFPQLQNLLIQGLKEWEEWIVEERSMPLLHSLEIWNCPKLKKLSAGGFPQLQKLKLKGLEEWEEWIVEEGSMPLLHTLYIHLCPKLKKLPAGGFPQLHTLYLKGLEEWEEWIVEEGSMPLLHSLHIWNCRKLKKFHACGFPQLQKLIIDGLKEWEEWIVEEGSMPLLHTLNIWNCPKLKKFPAGGFPRLQELIIDGLKEWEEWIVEEGSMPLLDTLEIRKCPNLKKLPVTGFPQLQNLSIQRLKEWEEWIVEEGSMPLLHSLNIGFCPKLKKIRAGGFPQLHTLELKNLEEWEEWIVEEGSMPLLHSLDIRKCPKLKKLPDGLSLIYSLKDLRMDKAWKERLSEIKEASCGWVSSIAYALFI